MHTGARFSVEKVFDLKGRPGLLVAGVVRSGVIKGGMVLRDEESEQAVRVTGIELHSGGKEAGAVTLIVNRHDAEFVREGATWVADAEASTGSCPPSSDKRHSGGSGHRSVPETQTRGCAGSVVLSTARDHEQVCVAWPGLS